MYNILNSDMVKHRPAIFRSIEHLTELTYGSILLLWVVQVLVFGTIYFTFAMFMPEHGPALQSTIAHPLDVLGDSLYFSVITTTTTGYGEIYPLGFSKALTGAQSVIGIFLWTLFVIKLVSHRQDIAIEEMHRLSYEEVFHNLREGLFIMRKDFDRIMRNARTHKHVSEDDWLDLVIAYRQGQSLLQEIPDLYATRKRTAHTPSIDDVSSCCTRQYTARSTA